MKQQKQSNHTNNDTPKEFNVSYIQHKSGTYLIEIDDTICSVSQFSSAIQVLGMAKEDDDVEIHLQSPGGSVDASGAFVHAMRKCPAHIHIVASGGCHSAATHILLEGTSFELADNFNSLIHNGGAGSIGNINEYVAQSEFDKKFIRSQYKAIYEGFLTDAEFDGMMRGDNIWLDAEGWIERYNKRNEYIGKKIEAMQKDQKKSTRKPKKVVDVAQ